MADPVVEMSPWTWIVPINTLLIFITGAATWLYTRGGKEAVLKQQVDSTTAALVVSTARAEKAEAANDALIERLHAHMLQDAAAFAKLESLASETARSSLSSELRLTNALDNLGKRIDGMTERFDSFLSMAIKQAANSMSTPQQ